MEIFNNVYVHRLFLGESQHILYLDVDTIVKHDISELWKQVVATGKLLVAIPK